MFHLFYFNAHETTPLLSSMGPGLGYNCCLLFYLFKMRGANQKPMDGFDPVSNHHSLLRPPNNIMHTITSESPMAERPRDACYRLIRKIC